MFSCDIARAVSRRQNGPTFLRGAVGEVRERHDLTARRSVRLFIAVARESRSDVTSSTLPKKLGIKPGTRVAVLSAPDGFIESTLQPLPDEIELRSRARGPLDVIVFFTKRRAELERRFDKLVDALDRAGALWVAWPKGTSGVATDLSENAVRDAALPKGLVDTKVAAIDDVWSGLKLVIRLENR
jgi:hypothetical protein